MASTPVTILERMRVDGNSCTREGSAKELDRRSAVNHSSGPLAAMIACTEGRQMTAEMLRQTFANSMPPRPRDEENTRRVRSASIEAEAFKFLI